MDIIVGELVPDKRNMLNTYVLHTTCKHSCGTSSNNIMRFDDVPLLKQYILFFEPFIDNNMRDPTHLTSAVIQTADLVNLRDNGPAVFKSVIPYDKSELGAMAVLTAMYVRYWDHNGHEHFVDTINK